MKRLLLLLGVSATLVANAQVQRMCMAEGFSNASCPPCASQNPGYFTVLSANTSKVISVKYQTNWPGTDPMNAQTQTNVGPRVTYYGVTGVPWGALDGTAYAGAAYSGALANLDNAEIDARYAITSPFAVTPTAALSSDNDSLFIDIAINTPAAFSAGSDVVKMHVLLIEKTIDFAAAPGSNGETEFHNVMRDMYPNASGTTLASSWTMGMTDNRSFDVALPNYIYDMSQLAVIVFIQNNNTKEVYQAAMVNAPVANYGVTENIANLSSLFCSSSASGITVDIQNQGSNTISTATVNYQVDAGTISTFPLPSAIAAAGTSTVNIPTLTGLTNGSHTLKTWLTNINASGSSTPIGLSSKTFVSSTSAATAPLTNNFSVAAFPYNGWALLGSANNWTRVTTSGGSAKFDCYNYAAGTSGEMVVEATDISGLTNPQLTFDVAHARYSAAEADILEVLVSTNCGSSWTSVFNKDGATLATNGGTFVTTAFTPSSSQWRNEVVSLSSYSSATSLFIKFKATSDYGNNIFVDNININSLSSVENNSLSTLNVYPNPTTDMLNLSFELTEESEVSVSVVNSLGQTVVTKAPTSMSASSNLMTLDVASLASGIYTVSIIVNGERTVKTFIKK